MNKKCRWTKEELSFLENNYKNLSVKDISKNLVGEISGRHELIEEEE